MDLQTLKNNYAQEQGYEDWDEIMFLNSRNPIAVENHMNEICIRAQKAALEKAAKSADLINDETTYFIWQVDISSITNPENLIQ